MVLGAGESKGMLSVSGKGLPIVLWKKAEGQERVRVRAHVHSLEPFLGRA